MIQMIVTYTCSRCESPNIVRNGHDYKGNQKYLCKDCGRYGTLNAQQGYDASIQAQVKRGMLERLSLRGMERMVSISRRTIQRWLTEWIEDVPPVATSLVPATSEDVLELDELWSFVGSKQQQRWFNTLRQRLARFTRKTLAFSKRDDLHDGLLRLFIYDYNLSCIS